MRCREPIVFGDDDRWMFLRTLGEMAGRTEIRVHAYALMERTSVPQKWIVEKLKMGSAPYVSRLAKEMGQRIARGDQAMSAGFLSPGKRTLPCRWRVIPV